MDDPYRLVACAFHDHLESYAVRRTPVRVTWRDPSEGSGLAATREAVTTIDDVFAADGADWVRLATGDPSTGSGQTVIRADRLIAVEPAV